MSRIFAMIAVEAQRVVSLGTSAPSGARPKMVDAAEIADEVRPDAA
jgi:hypothetical protein